MKKFMKKSVSIMLALIMAIGMIPLMPAQEVRADTVTDLVITSSRTVADEYHLVFNFIKPSFTAPLNPLVPNAGERGILGYEIYYRNLTKNQTNYDSSRMVTFTEGASNPAYTDYTDDNATITLIADMMLDPGCIYTFQVRVLYQQWTWNSTTSTWGWVSLSGDPVNNANYAALTNIRVEAVGDNGSMTVEFDYPSLPGNTAFFDQYQFHFVNLDGGTSANLQWSMPPKTAAVSQLQIADGKAKYTMYDSEFQVGRIFAVKVEPMHNGNTRENLVRLLNLGSYTNHNFRSDITVDYMADDAYVRPTLTISTSSLTNLDISWDSLANKPLSSYIRSIKLIQITEGPTGWDSSATETVVFRAEGDSISNHTNTSIRKPPGVARYRLEVEYRNLYYKAKDNTIIGPYNVTVISHIAEYNPGALDFAPYRPDIYEIKDNGAKPFHLDITWEGFSRDPLTDLERAVVDSNGKYFETGVLYEIYITDDPANFDRLTAPDSYERDGDVLTSEYINGYPHFRDQFEQYWRRNSDGTMEQVPLVQNKIYYVKIKATRKATGEVARFAYGSHYIMPIDKIPVQPNMIAKPPLRIKKVDGLEVIDETSFTIEWDEQWFEIYNPDDGKWYSKAQISGGSIIYDGYNNGTTVQSVKDADNFLVNDRIPMADGLLNKRATKDAFVTMVNNAGITALDRSVFRMIDIRNASYKLHVAEYDIMAQDGYDVYYDEIIRETTVQTWDDIGYDRTGPITLEHKVETSHNQAATPLNPGVSYVAFLRPYNVTEEGDKLAYYPSYVTATTLIDRGDMDITPTVPVLEAVDATDTSLTVRWKYTKELKYELRYDEIYNNYPDGGKLITSDEIEADATIQNEASTGQAYMYYTIYRLFPDTMYYIWIRSVADNSSGLEYSGWSNALEMRTLDIAPPPPPKGLGLASKYNLGVYNQVNGTDFLPSDVGYLVVEWLRIYDDLNNEEGGESQNGSAEDSDLAQYLPNPLVDETYMVKFNELIDNKVYYVRAKTRLILSKGTDGAVRSYTYIVQLSLDPDFIDYIEIEVPVTGDITSGIYKDSEWTSVQLFSDKSDNEYDGDKNPDQYPLPDTDFEIIYDTPTDTLTYRFRSNEKDKDGNHDNLVDERFISRLVANRTFEYTVDLSTYGTRVPKNRIVEFPYSIIAAFNERKINLKVKAGDYTVTFPHDSLMTVEVNGLTNLNRNAKVRISISENPAGIVSDEKTNYVSGIHKLAVNLNTTAQNVNIINFAKPLNMNLAVSGQYVEGATNMGAYVQDGNTAGWQRLNGNFDTISKSINFTSQRSASYSAIGLVTPWSETQAETLNQMYAVNSKMNITDLGYYNENTPVNIVQFNQLMAAALKGSTSVKINEPLATEDYNSLGKSKLLVAGSGGSAVTREVGISALVKLFEIKTKYPVTGYPGINDTGYSDIASAAPEYRTPMLKAVELGFYRGGSANPKGQLTFGDMMHMLDIILSY